MKRLKSILVSSFKSGLGCLTFLALIQPFGIDQLKEGRIEFIISESLLATLVIAISACIDVYVLKHDDRHITQMKDYAKSVLIRTAIGVPTLGAVLLSYASWFNTGSIFSHWMMNGEVSLYGWGVMCCYVTFISVFIVIWDYYKFKTTKLSNELENIKAINALLEERQEKLAEEAEKEMEAMRRKEREAAAKGGDSEEQGEAANDDDKADDEVCILDGQGQEAHLAINPKNIIYVESMANYADVCYLDDGDPKHKTMRITLKQIRESLSSMDYIMQCHRAFLVNINFVIALSGRSSGLQLQIFGMEKMIPVSRANTEEIKQKLMDTN